MSRHGDDRWYEDRRKLIFRITIGLAFLVLVVLVLGLRSEYLRLQALGHQHDADRMITALAAVFLIATPVILIIGGWFVYRIGRRVSVRMEADFEISISHLSLEEQEDARRQRNSIRDRSSWDDPV